MAYPKARTVVVWRINLDGSTGDHLGYGTMTGPNRLVILHRAAAEALLAETPKNQLNLRLQVIDHADKVNVADGAVHLTTDARFSGAAVSPFTRPMKVQPAQDYWYIPTTDLIALLDTEEKNDPKTPPLPPPSESDPPLGQGPLRVVNKPPWCYVLPSCPGCK